MLVLINANRMLPPIAPVGLDYLAGAARDAGIEARVLDLCWAEQHEPAVAEFFAAARPQLVGLSLRNVDDCFWPSAAWFVPEIIRIISSVRAATEAPIALGGVGFSIFASQLVERTGADFGIRGDGEQAIVQLMTELQHGRRFENVEGLIWRDAGRLRANSPAWPRQLVVPTQRDAMDNARYFRRGGQIGVETKRGCTRQCAYCADPLAKGTAARLRPPEEVADEIAALLRQGVDVLHLCDSEFNLPPDHAHAVCEAMIARGLHRRVRWYAYLSVVPFGEELAAAMARAGCAGINFTSDSASPRMLAAYGQPHGKDDLAAAVRACRRHAIAVMLDLLLGGPGETPETVAETIGFCRQLEPDAVGAALGVRIYPQTAMARIIAAERPLESNPGLRRRYAGPVDLLQPTFYISSALGHRPAALVRELIGGDPRFFPPQEEAPAPGEANAPGDHNYNQNQALCEALAAGARGAYWDILRRWR